MMDNLGKGAGLGSHPEGAFERFLTAAIATIITIMFSWRLLEEQDEVDRGVNQHRTKQFNKPVIKPQHNNDPGDNQTKLINQIQPEKSQQNLCQNKTATDTNTHENSGTDEDYCVSDDDDSPSWANYSWEEDMYTSVHTRRSARDFISSAKTKSDNTENECDPSPPLSSKLLEDMYVNSEYQSIVENSDFDAMQISDSSGESDSDEEEFDLIPDESDIYCPQTLPPIIEEDSDESGSENESPNEHCPFPEPQSLTRNSVLQKDGSCDPPCTGNIKPFVADNKHQLELDLNVNTPDFKEQCQLNEKLENENKKQLTEFDENVDFCESPVRTCALDDDEDNLSDESCSTCSSSASVMTVVSVNTWEANKETVDLQKSNDTSQVCLSDLSNCEKVKNHVNSDIIAFIHNEDNASLGSSHSDLEETNDKQILCEKELNHVTETELKLTSAPALQTVKNLSTESSDLDYDDFVQSVKGQSELIMPENTETDRPSLTITEDIPSTYESNFDEDVQPREYNPFESDFCDSSEDTDDSDSFFMVVGNNGHLRNFDTVTNLDYVGISHPCEDLRTLVRSPNSSLVFSRTQEISTEHRYRCFVRDRNADTDNSDEYLNDINEIDLVIRESNEDLNECPLILDSAANPQDAISSNENAFHHSENSISEQDALIDEKTRLLNEANTASTKIDIPLDSKSPTIRIEDVPSQINMETLVLDCQERTTESDQNNVIYEQGHPKTQMTCELNETSNDTIDETTHIPLETGETKQYLEQGNKEENVCVPETNEHQSLSENQRKLNDSEINFTNINETWSLSTDEGIENKLTLDVENVKTENNFHTQDIVIEEADKAKDNVCQNLEYMPHMNLYEMNKNSVNSEKSEDFASNTDLSTDQNKQKTKEDISTSAEDELLDANRNVKNVLHIDENTLCSQVIPNYENSHTNIDAKSIHECHTNEVRDNDTSNTRTKKPVDKTIYDQNLELWNNYLDKSASSRVVRTPAVKPSSFRDVKGVKARLNKQVQKPRPPIVYESVLLKPVTEPERKTFVFELPKNVPMSRQKIFALREKFLSQESLLPSPLKDKFAFHKASLTSIPRQNRYQKRENHSSRSSLRNLSTEKIDHISNLYSSRIPHDESFEKRELHSLHENCMFSPHIHEEILNTTESIDNLNSSFSLNGSSLSRYDSVASLVETDIDSGETTETFFVYNDSDTFYDFDFQSTIKRAHSMSELGARKQTKKTPRNRFADKSVTKSKSLQTLETNIDDVFTAKGEGNLARVPSVHELRVTKSLQKLNVPDWYKNSSVSRSGSTFSLYEPHHQRRDSTSTTSSFGYPPSLSSSACQSPSLHSNPVVIRTRVMPPSAKFFRVPKLPMTPEKAPISPASISLPSDKFRKKEKPKELMPIPIVPFSKLRLMFEKNAEKRTEAQKDNSPVKSSTNVPLHSQISSSTKQTEPESITLASSPKRPNHIEVSQPKSSKNPPSILKKSTLLSATIDEKTPFQLSDHYTNGELNHEPYKKLQAPDEICNPDYTNSDEPVENIKLHIEEKPRPVPVKRTKPPVQPKPPSVPSPRQARSNVAQQAQSRKETTV